MVSFRLHTCWTWLLGRAVIPLFTRNELKIHVICYITLCRGVKIPNEAIYGMWAATCNAYYRIPVTEHSVTWRPMWSCELRHSTLALTRLRQAIAAAWFDQLANHIKPWHLCSCPNGILQIALLANKYPTLFYLKAARRRWLRVNCAEITKLETI